MAETIDYDVKLRDSMSPALKDINKEFTTLIRQIKDLGDVSTTAFRKTATEVTKYQEVTKKSKDTWKELTESVTTFSSKLVGPLGVATGLLTVNRALEEFARNRVGMQHFATDTGLSASALDQLQRAMKRAGFSIAEANKAISGITGGLRNIGIRGFGSEEYQAIARMGVLGRELANALVKDMKSGDIEGALQRVLRAIAAQPDTPAGRAAREQLAGVFNTLVSQALAAEKELKNVKRRLYDTEAEEEYLKKQADFADRLDVLWTRIARSFVQVAADASWKNATDNLREFKTEMMKTGEMDWSKTAIGQFLKMAQDAVGSDTLSKFWDQLKKFFSIGASAQERPATFGERFGVGDLTGITADEMQRRVPGADDAQLPGGARPRMYSPAGDKLIGVEEDSKKVLEEIRDTLQGKVPGIGGTSGATPGAAPGGLPGPVGRAVATPGLSIASLFSGGRGAAPGGAATGAGAVAPEAPRQSPSPFPSAGTAPIQFPGGIAGLGGGGGGATFGERFGGGGGGALPGFFGQLPSSPGFPQTPSIGPMGALGGAGVANVAAALGGAAPSSILAGARAVALSGGPGAVADFMRQQGYPKSGAWCGQFAAAVVSSVGGTPPRNPAVASNWRNWGTPVEGMPQPGDVAVRRGARTGSTGSHVTFVESVDPATGRFRGLGGNQRRAGEGMISQYNIGRFEFRRGAAPDAGDEAQRTPAARRSMDQSMKSVWEGSANIAVDFTNVPQGVRTNVEGDGFKTLKITRSPQAPRAGGAAADFNQFAYE